MNETRLDNNRTGTVASINLSAGGVPKKHFAEATVARFGIWGDAQNDTHHHGGPDRAVTLYSFERIVALRAEGHPINPGTAGENVTVEGLDWELIIPGTHLRIGDEVVLEIASFASPCKTIAASFVDGKFSRINEKLHPGWSRVCARVLSEGQIRLGDRVRVSGPPQSA